MIGAKLIRDTVAKISLRSPAGIWAWAAGLTTLVFLSGFCVHRYYPPLPSPLQMEVSLDRGTPGSIEPLLVTGLPHASDFLQIVYRDETTVAFGYDSWGEPGLWSKPIPISPNVRRPLSIEMPGLSQIRGQLLPETKRLRVVYDGVPVLEAEVASHLRASKSLYFGQNPNDGGFCGPEFSGKLFRPNGRELRGGVVTYFTARDRLVGWLTLARSQQTAVLVLSALLGVCAYRLRRLTRERLRRLGLAARATFFRHRWFAASAAIGWLANAAVLIHGSTPVSYPESLRWFYDYQATSLLHGRLDVPYVAIPGEAYLFEGRHYGYFGITPALLRIPFLVFDIAFGDLTDAFMLAEHLACLIAAYLILRHIDATARGRDAIPAPWTVILFTANVGLGSTLFFLSSRGFLYHESIMCGVFFALASCYCTLRYFATPQRRWWVGALIGGTLSAHARATVGFFALTLLGASALAILLQRRFRVAPGETGVAGWRLPVGWPKHVAIGLLSVVGLLSLNGLSYFKFRTFDAMPFQYNEQYDAARVARIEGKGFHLSNMPLNAEAYLLRPLWKFRPHFPYVYAQGHQPTAFPKARIDQAEPLLGLPFAMPGLFWLAAGGMISAFWRHRALRPALLVLSFAGLPMSIMLLAAVATSQRYSADFCPLLVCGASYGVVMVDSLPRAWRRLAHAVTGALTGAAILISLALTLHYQGELLWGVPDDVAQSYRALRVHVDRLFGIQNH